MKKIYCAPVAQVSEAEVQNMVAVSIIDGQADANSDVLTKEDSSWSMWEDED